MAKSFFRLRKTLCFLMDLRSAMSFGSSRVYFTASITYPTVPLESPGWRHHLIEEPYPVPRVGPRLGLQLGAHPSILPHGPTSSTCP